MIQPGHGTERMTKLIVPWFLEEEAQDIVKLYTYAAKAARTVNLHTVAGSTCDIVDPIDPHFELRSLPDVLQLYQFELREKAIIPNHSKARS